MTAISSRPSPDPDAAAASLFRAEVVAERRAQWLGTVLLAPRRSHRLFTVFAVVAGSAVLALLFFGQYTRKARISGWLVPDQGLVQVFAPMSGVVTDILVAEGTQVRRGQRLFVLSAEVESTVFGATQSEVARRLKWRHQSLATERRETERLGEQRLQALQRRVEVLGSELQQLDREIAVQRSRLSLANQDQDRQRKLFREGVVSEQQRQSTEASTLDQVARLRALERQSITTLRERLTLKGELADLPLTTRARVASLEQTMAVVELELAQAEARRELVVSSPSDGTVTAIQAERGGRATPTVALLSIMPAGSRLQAHLFGPTRAMGFLRPGQRVLLRYQAYPYQKFGHHQGIVASISASALNPRELPPRLVGLTSLLGTGEPVYRLTVNLARQSITAYGREVPLQSGLQLEADVLIESRRLVEWMLEPLYTLTGKWNR
jgi:membrane fusion protein